MKRLLLICYYFPPLGGAGVNRPLALVKQLPKHGWEVHVLTVKPVTYRMYEPELLDSIDTTHVYRSGSRDPQRLMWLMGLRKPRQRVIERARPASDRFFPDNKVGWLRPAVRLGRTLVANQRYDAIVSTSPPITCHLIARHLARETGLPWVADFRDYWTSRKPADWYDSDSMTARAEKLLADISRQASGIVAVNGAVAHFVNASYVIPNAFDPDLATAWQPPDPEDFVIGVMGTLNEMLPIAPLIELLRSLRQHQPDLFERVKLVHAGDVDPDWLTRQLQQAALTDRMTSWGFLPREEAFKKLSAAAVFYLGLANQMDLGVTTARIYDIIASGRPILACLPGEGELSQLLREFDHTCVYAPDQNERARDWLTAQMRRHFKGELTPNADTPDIQRHSSVRLAESYAQLLDSLTETT